MREQDRFAPGLLDGCVSNQPLQEVRQLSEIAARGVLGVIVRRLINGGDTATGCPDSSNATAIPARHFQARCVVVVQSLVKNIRSRRRGSWLSNFALAASVHFQHRNGKSKWALASGIRIAPDSSGRKRFLFRRFSCSDGVKFVLRFLSQSFRESVQPLIDL